jgi:3-methyladenine DNA glycosylase AlkC
MIHAMAEPFKLLLNADTVATAATHLSRAWADFPATRFKHLAQTGLDELEFKARAQHIRAALEATLPSDFDHAATIIENSLAPVRPVDDESIPKDSAAGLAGWIVWSLGDFVAVRGQHDVERSLQCLHVLTQRFTAEFAIRPFIAAHQATVLKTLERWVSDPSPHVRRLVSEGTRPRLPWGIRLHDLVRDPTPMLPLLRALQDDPSDDVRRSVANHLNDIAKDHPEVLHAWLREHLPKATSASLSPLEATRRATLRHACRGLIKAGDAKVMAAWGVGAPWAGSVALRLSPRRVQLGQVFELRLQLQSTEAKKAQALEIDYVLRSPNATGAWSSKTFKGWRVSVPARGAVELVKRHPMRHVTTRTLRAGRHEVEVRINGTACAQAEFALQMP